MLILQARAEQLFSAMRVRFGRLDVALYKGHWVDDNRHGRELNRKCESLTKNIVFIPVTFFFTVLRDILLNNLIWELVSVCFIYNVPVVIIIHRT